MSSQTEIPGTWGSFSTSIGSPAQVWSNPSNAGSTSSGSVTSSQTTLTTSQSQALEGSNCGFSVSGTINGITQTFQRKCNVSNAGNNTKDDFVYLLVASPGTTPTVSANNYAATSTLWPTAFAAASYGTGTTDLWGSSWTSATINGSDFGVLIQVAFTRLGTTPTGSLYDSSVTVFYTVGAAFIAPPPINNSINCCCVQSVM